MRAPDFAERLAPVPACRWCHSASRRAAELVAAQFGTVAAAAEGCDALVAAGMRQFAARSVTGKPGIRYVYASYQPVTLPSPHHPPSPRPGRPFPPDVTGNRVLLDLDAQSVNALFGAALSTHQVRHAGPGALLRPMVASDLRSELMT